MSNVDVLDQSTISKMCDLPKLDLPEPIRGVSFSLEHFEEHASVVAKSHVIDPSLASETELWIRFEENARVLERAYRKILAAVEENQGISPGAEWLLDNYYVVRDQLREIRHDLPQRYLRELPKLASGPLGGRPRVYAIALEAIAHSDSAVDDEMLVRFVKAYVQASPLTIGELWAIPIMLRLGLIENLRRLADQIVITLEDQQRADRWIDEIVRDQPSNVLGFLEKQARSDTPLSSPLVIRLVQRCRDQGHELATCWQWLEQRVTATGDAIDEIVRQEHQRQAHNQVSTGNAITSMRLLSALDWNTFFERVSLVDDLLCQDPAGVYNRMDFATRDRYRHVIEQLAKRSKVTETEVAWQALSLATNADSPTTRHVGYYLIDAGRPQLEEQVGYRPSIRARFGRWLAGFPTVSYLGAICLTFFLVIAVLVTAMGISSAPIGPAVLTLLVALLPASELAVSVVNFLTTKLVRPHILPKLDFKEGIPPDFRTIVVMPTLIHSSEGIRTLVGRLEIHFLANPDDELAYALLADLPDAPSPSMPEDESLLAEANRLIGELNDRYSDSPSPRFWLFHRVRQWNPVEGKWMAWERKRGKLSEFNRLLRGDQQTSYVLTQELSAELRAVKYVITLDADTQLPLGAARKLIGTLGHPLNQRVVLRRDADAGQPHQRSVLESRGYSILQPRVNLNVISSRRTPFSRCYSGSPHIDPYVTAVSDVYQDCFGEGSYIGKGIYDIDAFESIVGDAFPENQILSHDLIEGCYAGAALVTDIEVIDDFPSHYHSYVRRQHRWVRGDWQILPWLFPHVPTSDGSRRNPLSLISRWKIFDNLRRSLVPPALLLYLAVAWIALPGSGWLWTLFALLVLALPFGFQLISTALARPSHMNWFRHMREHADDFKVSSSQTLLAVAFLVDQAHAMIDAVLRTLSRLYITRRHLLEWESAAVTEKRFQSTFVSYLKTMWSSPVVSLTLGALLIWQGNLAAFLSALPLLLLWSIAPLIAARVSSPTRSTRVVLTSEERRELRDIARQTWLFFETFVTEQENWLPPDNFQEVPRGVVAHRTSPTNEGLFLISSLAARDFGYLGLHELADLLERNLDRWLSLEHYRGHPFNWYDTQTGRVLPPAYVSTVDSGNLGVCLLTLRQGLLELLDKPILGPQLWEGLSDALRIDRTSESPKTSEPSEPEAHSSIAQLLAHAAPTEVSVWRSRLEEINGHIPLHATEPSSENGRPFHALANQIHQLLRDLVLLCPWEIVANAAADQSAQSKPTNSDSEVEDRLRQALTTATTLRELARLRSEWSEHISAAKQTLAAHIEGNGTSEIFERLNTLLRAMHAGSNAAEDLMTRLLRIAERCHTIVSEMDFSFLYNPRRHLFSVGYNLSTGQLDRSHYDLMASESRLASFLAIGKGDTEHRHWLHLGRPLTKTVHSRCLLSWGGTMFEYLMPLLFLRAYEDTLLSESCRAAVDRQIDFGRQARLPWGISESAFATLDGHANYQYQSFGVPGLGLKRGLSEERVVSPYSTALALAIRPREALANFRHLTRHGALGPFGYYEAIDYTTDRLPRGGSRSVVQCYMAHHQGMIVSSIANCLFDGILQRRFHAEPTTRAAEMLLHERVPLGSIVVEPHRDEIAVHPDIRETPPVITRRLTTAETASPRTHLLSNSAYAVMITNAGGGYSCYHGLQVSRWRPDTVRDCWGQFIYVRDLRSNLVWSAAYQPTRRLADSYEVLFSVDKAEFRRRDGDIETHMEITVSPEHDAELRQVSVINLGSRTRWLDVTSYAELALASFQADIAHPAFQKLFVETEFLADRNTLLAMRRPRSAEEPPVWAIHTLAFDDSPNDNPQALRGSNERSSANPSPAGTDLEFETDRNKFLGRGRTPLSPAAILSHAELSRTTGAVLDPIFSLRRKLRLPPGQSARLAFTTAVAKSREEALSLADQYHDMRSVLRAFELAWAHSQVELRHRHLSPADSHLFQRLASQLIYPDGLHRAAPAVLTNNRQGQMGLWRYGISGDHPIVLVRITQPRQDGLVRELLLAHEYWRTKCLTADLVVLNEYPTGYADEVQEQLQHLLGETGSWGQLNKPGGVYILHASRLPEEDRILVRSAAHVVLHGEAGSLAAQLDIPPQSTRWPARLPFSRLVDSNNTSGTTSAGDLELPKGAQYFNGLGGFSPDGREYVMLLRSGESTPAPWYNIISNPSFGCLVSESGSGYTWAENSRENTLTTWSNDPVSDVSGEAIYVRDEDTGDFWSPTPLPCRSDDAYLVRHGQGYSRFEHRTRGILHDLLISIALTDTVKFSCLKLRNESSRRRRLSVTYGAEWVLGVNREQTQMHITTEIDQETGALFAMNRFHPELANQVAFLHVLHQNRTATGDRREFFGRNYSWECPQAMRRIRLSGNVGAGLDPFGAVQTQFELGPGEQLEVIFLLGQQKGPQEVRSCLQRFHSIQRVHEEIDKTCGSWDQLLTAVQVTTPDPALNILMNRWLLYQVVSSRLLGRTAFYQRGGAYGYRDQLQDVMALVYSEPRLAREHILRAASRQFEQGDVQHWWHVRTGWGIRTRFSDDSLWLPFVVGHYLETTNDTSVLDEMVPFLQSASLEPHEHERYEIPGTSDQVDTLYGHCLRAIDHGLRFGSHDLPLIGGGDWNDGMNRVGREGRGESVWLGWFLLKVLKRFVPVAEARGDSARAAALHEHADKLLVAIEQHGWDGQWYRRAYFDDGQPLGSRENDECQIDCLAQSWSVIAGGDPERCKTAMQSVVERLVRFDERVVRLLTPPFDTTTLDPGYIKGYLPGIRENGGQYTHAALWVVQAFTQLGDSELAMAIFNLLNPILHADSPDRTKIYKVEPFVVAADVYSTAPHIGRGGWTWYTGSAAWMYRVALENILGFQLRGDSIRLKPCIPRTWAGFEITYRHGTTNHHIVVEHSSRLDEGAATLYLDGEPLSTGNIPLLDDGKTHEIVLRL